ncbi:DUF3500 domain-containing protein [Lacunimicrobium album]
MKKSLAVFCLAISCLVFAGTSSTWAHPGHGAAAAKTAPQVAELMATAANRLLMSLTEEQRKQVVFEFGDEEREDFHFVPDKFIKPEAARKGLTIEQMQPNQKNFAKALPATALSNRGFLEAMSIMSLEQFLFELEKGNEIRNPQRYYVSIFGTPSATGTWGWRFEGHHLSVNVTIIDGKKFSVTPSFFGTNPAIIQEGPMKGTEVLVGEERIALDLVKTLTAEQMKKVMIPGSNVDEVITSDERTAKRETFEQHGLVFEDLTAEQQQKLLSLVNVYLGRFQPEILQGTKFKGLLEDGKGLRFAWSGGTELGQQHYYRIVSSEFLIEFANSQNNHNHIHAVLRDFKGDFGRDFLAEHYKEGHTANNAHDPKPSDSN